MASGGPLSGADNWSRRRPKRLRELQPPTSLGSSDHRTPCPLTGLWRYPYPSTLQCDVHTVGLGLGTTPHHARYHPTMLGGRSFTSTPTGDSDLDPHHVAERVACVRRERAADRELRETRALQLSRNHPCPVPLRPLPQPPTCPAPGAVVVGCCLRKRAGRSPLGWCAPTAAPTLLRGRLLPRGRA